MPYWCLACRSYFSVRKGTVMQSSKLGYRTWLISMYLLLTHPKGYSSRQLAKTLGVSRTTAWHLERRIREGFALGTKTENRRYTAPASDLTYPLQPISGKAGQL